MRTKRLTTAAELLIRKKYTNPRNLLAFASQKADSTLPLWLAEGTSPQTTTVLLLTAQYQLNRIFINSLLTEIVFRQTPKSPPIFPPLLLAARNALAATPPIHSILAIPPETVSRHYAAHRRANPTQYKAMGDFEWELAIFAAPFCTHQAFCTFLDLNRQVIESSPLKQGVCLATARAAVDYFADLSRILNGFGAHGV